MTLAPHACTQAPYPPSQPLIRSHLAFHCDVLGVQNALEAISDSVCVIGLISTLITSIADIALQKTIRVVWAARSPMERTPAFCPRT